MDNGIKLYMKQHGDTVAGKKIELIRKDTGGIAPDIAKRLAQERVVRGSVELLAGFCLPTHPPPARGGGGAAGESKGDPDGVAAEHQEEGALHGAHVVHRAAVEPDAGDLGVQERHPKSLYDGFRFRPRP